MKPKPINLLISRAGNLARAGICVFLAWALLYQGDLLGLGPATDRQSSQLVELGVGALRPSLYPGNARGSLIVVTVDDLSLAAANEIYPPSHHFHARILQRILEQRPKAVFIDIVLDTCRDGTADLLAALDHARKLGIAVYVAAGRPWPTTNSVIPLPTVCGAERGIGPVNTARTDLGVLPEIAARAVPVDVMRPVGEMDSDEYCLVPAPGRDELCLGSERLAGLPSDPKQIRLSAAFRIYRDLCTGPWWPGCGTAEQAPPVAWPPRSAKIDVMWGYGAADQIDAGEDRNVRCNAAASSMVERLPEFLVMGVESLRWPCPYTPSMSVMPLLANKGGMRLGSRLVSLQPEVDRSNPPTRKERRDPLAALRDRVVLYGFDLSGSADLIRPSTQVALPGVFLHAMALDNLLTWGEHYKADAAWVGMTRVGADNVNFLTFLAIFMLCYVTRHWAAGRDTPAAVILRTISSPLNLLALCLFLGGVYTLYLDLAPINWLAIVAFSAGVPRVIEWATAVGTKLFQSPALRPALVRGEAARRRWRGQNIDRLPVREDGMRIRAWAIVVATLVAGAPSAGRAAGYITGVLTDPLEVYASDGSGPIYRVPASDITGPIRISEEIDDIWLEIVVEGEYYRVRRADVQTSRVKTAGGTPMGPAAGQGARLRFGGN